MTRISVGLIVTLLSSAVAAPLWAHGTYTAASCNYSDVNAVINGPKHIAVDGDTILIPSCPSGAIWTSSITVSGVGITIQGSGTPNSTPSTTGASSSCTATLIIDNDVTNPALFYFKPTATNSPSRVSCIKIHTGTTGFGIGSLVAGQGVCNSTTCPNLRIDNLTLDSSLQAALVYIIVTDNVFGVIDHNSLAGTKGPGDPGFVPLEFVNFGNSAWQGVGDHGDNSWASPDTYGTNQALYLENNLLGKGVVLGETEGHTPNLGAGGGRIVARFNNCNGCYVGLANHGTESDGRTRGGRQMEYYGNTYLCTNTGGYCGGGAEPRSGTVIQFGNTFTAAAGVAGVSQYLHFDDYRTLTPFGVWGACDGSTVYDTNDGGATPTVYATGAMGTVTKSGGVTATVPIGTCTSGSLCPTWATNQLIPSGAPYAIHDVTTGDGAQITSNTSNTIIANGWSTYPNFNTGDTYQILRARVCIDQPNRSGGTYLSGTTPRPAAAVNQSLDPSYEWDDSGVAPGANVVAGLGTLHMIANRDWYTDNSLGRPHAQTSPTSPFNGRVGVGFGTLANRPTTCTPAVGYFATDQGHWNHSSNGFGQGELFVCTATNIWTLAYTPYIYPHPLAQPGVPSPPSNLLATSQ